MKTAPVLCLVLLALASAATAETREPSAPAPARTPLFQPGQTIVFEGDSLTSRDGETRHSWSYLRLSNWQGTWADVVEDFFFCNRPEMELQFRNAAIGGSSVQELLARYDRTVKRIEPDWVLLTTGGNDARRFDLDTYENGLNTYLRRLHEELGARVVIVDIFHPELWPTTPEIAEKRLRFMAAARKILEKYDGMYINAGDTLYERDRILKKQWEGHTVMADGGHLNAVGARIVGFVVLEAVGALTIH
jgi:lysophospholipase L1-like esterase